MKKSYLLVSLCLLSLLISGCKDLNGSIEVLQSLKLKSSSGDLFEVAAGSHRVQLKVNSKKKFDLIVTTVNGEQTATFKTNQNLKKIQSGQRLQMSSDVSGQPVNLDGVYLVKNENSENRRTIESCTYYTTEYRCRMETTPQQCTNVTECNPQNPSQCETRNVCSGGITQQVCGDVQIPHSGDQEVEYYYSTQTESVEMDLLSASNLSVAKVLASDSKSDKHYTYQGICR